MLSFADGTSYAGEFSDGMNSGHGVLVFNDGSKYEGQFEDGKYNGYGVYSDKAGMRYEGEFRSGKVRARKGGSVHLSRPQSLSSSFSHRCLAVAR